MSKKPKNFFDENGYYYEWKKDPTEYRDYLAKKTHKHLTRVPGTNMFKDHNGTLVNLVQDKEHTWRYHAKINKTPTRQDPDIFQDRNTLQNVNNDKRGARNTMVKTQVVNVPPKKKEISKKHMVSQGTWTPENKPKKAPLMPEYENLHNVGIQTRKVRTGLYPKYNSVGTLVNNTTEEESPEGKREIIKTTENFLYSEPLRNGFNQMVANELKELFEPLFNSK